MALAVRDHDPGVILAVDKTGQYYPKSWHDGRFPIGVDLT